MNTISMGQNVVVTAVPDMTAAPDATVEFVGKNADKAAALIAAGNAQGGTAYLVRYNDFKYHSGEYRYLFDCGLGSTRARPEALLAAVKEAGFDPDGFRNVCLFTISPECIDSLVKDGKPLFGKSQLAVPVYDILKKGDAEFGRADVQRLLAAAPGVAEFHGDGQFGDSGLFVSDIAAPGPSRGHVALEGRLGGGVSMIFLGELLRYPSVQLPYPDVSPKNDADPAQAAESRRAVLGQAADNNWYVAGAYLPFPGIGTVRRDGDGFVFTPVDEKDAAARVAAGSAVADAAKKQKDAEAAKIPSPKQVSATVFNKSSRSLFLRGSYDWDDQVLYAGREKVSGDGHELPPKKHVKVHVKWGEKAGDLMMGLLVTVGEGGGSWDLSLGYLNGRLDVNPEFIIENGPPAVKYEISDQEDDCLTLTFTYK